MQYRQYRKDTQTKTGTSRQHRDLHRATERQGGSRPSPLVNALRGGAERNFFCPLGKDDRCPLALGPRERLE